MAADSPALKFPTFRNGLRRPSRAALDATAAAEPNPLFDRGWYLRSNPDITAAQVDPWRHYVEFGADEGRDPNALFDNDWYLKRYAGLIPADSNPLLHYWDRGAAQGCDPNPLFDSDWYLKRYPEVRRQRLNPLLHYWRVGAASGCDPCAQFDTAWYLRANPDVRPGALTALGDYLVYGHREGRSIRSPQTANATVRAPQSADLYGRIAVYTAIAGDYDCLKIPTEIDANCDYFCFTDRDISWQSVWVRREFTWRHEDPVRVARRVKHQPHDYFSEHEWSIWIDANLQLNCRPQALMPSSHEDCDLAVWRHPYRDCTYAEAQQCVLEGKDDPATIHAQMQRYRGDGFPEHAGLNENNVLVRRHNAPAMVELAKAWWDEIARGSRRDQLSFAFLERQRDLRIAYLGASGCNARNDPRVRFFTHTLPREGR